jgi:hypothetical protein
LRCSPHWRRPAALQLHCLCCCRKAWISPRLLGLAKVLCCLFTRLNSIVRGRARLNRLTRFAVSQCCWTVRLLSGSAKLLVLQLEYRLG